MSKTEPAFTHLTTCADPSDASVLRSLLDANGIACVVQGEQHSGMLGLLGGAIIEVRVLVATKDLEQTRALLSAEIVAPKPRADGREASPGSDAEEAVCPVHGERCTATCGRCGTFLCARCEAPGNPPLCEDCVVREGTGSEVRRKRRRKLVAWALVLINLAPLPFLPFYLLHKFLG